MIPLLSIIAVVLCAQLGAFIGRNNGSMLTGFVVGLLLGPLGLIIVAAQGPTRLERRRRILDRERVEAEWKERAARLADEE